MFVPSDYLRFRQASRLLPDTDDEWGDNDPKGERLGSALASGELLAEGVVIGADNWNNDLTEMGEIRQLRPETWRTPLARDAVLGDEPTERLYQDGYAFTPIIRRNALHEWIEKQSPPKPFAEPNQTAGRRGIPGLSFGIHAIPAGYIAFDRIPSVARVWASEGKIDKVTLDLLTPPDTDAMTEALATGTLRAFGVSKRTGEILSLPPSVWRIQMDGAPQSIWAIAGVDVLNGPDGEPCLPVITYADLARALGLQEVPPDPDEMPEGWQPAQPLELPSPACNGDMDVDAWMRGYAEGFKANKNTVKRDDAIQAATKSLGCTTRRAEAAYEALPYPELRNPPRKTPA